MQAWQNGMGDIGMIKGGACLVDLARRGRCRRRSRSPGHQRPRGLPERRGGRNSKYIANRGNTKQDMTIRSAKRALTRYYTLQTKGGNIRGWIPDVRWIPDKGKEGESFQVQHARGMCQMNGLQIRIRWIFLSNFHVENIFIGVTVYFILILKDLNHF